MNRYVLSVLTLIVGIFLILGCGGEGTVGLEYARWTFSGYVVDGSTNESLSDVKIEYYDTEGEILQDSTDNQAAFFIQSLPYGQKVFRFSYARIEKDDTLYYGERMITASSMTESSVMEGVIANGTRLIKLYPLNGSIHGKLNLQLSKSGRIIPAKGFSLHIQYKDSTFVNNQPSHFYAETDSIGNFEFDHLPADSNMVLTIASKEVDGIRYEVSPVLLPRLFSNFPRDIGHVLLTADTLNDEALVIASSVQDLNGIGVTGVSTTAEPWYVLSSKIKIDQLDLQVFSGDSLLEAYPVMRNDTLIIKHYNRFPSASWIEVRISGVNSEGRLVSAVLDGVERFQTKKPLRAIASNTWNSNAEYKSEFAMQDTLWVRFSDTLGAVEQIQWSKLTTGKTLYGAGQSANSKAWIKVDTLFLVPDQRLVASAGETIGFNIVLQGSDSTFTDAVVCTSVYSLGAYSILYTNTKDLNGVARVDMGVLDSVVVVSNKPIAELLNVTTVDSLSFPTGFQMTDIELRGTDTLIYRPKTSMLPGAWYGMAFDIKAPNGRVYVNSLSVRWKTAYEVKIVSVNNRDQSGFRRFASIGDSLVVAFSKAIDTSSKANVPFKVHMSDVNGKIIQNQFSWNATFTQVTIKNVSYLPLADFGITNTNLASGDKARAVNGVTFDLTTKDGEIVYALKPTTEAIKIYTEAGLCVVNTNILKSHLSDYEVKNNEAPKDNFPIDSVVRVTFNRTLDTTKIKANPTGYASLQSGLGVNVAATVSFTDQGRTIVIKPNASLAQASQYWLKLSNVPALGVSDAGAISSLSGTFSGTATTSAYLLFTGFSTP